MIPQKLHQEFLPSNMAKRSKAIDRLVAKNDIVGLLRVLESKYADAVEKAEIALCKYQFK
ncbi:Uncharacterised protein [Candidatus Bilamarchaeum dharawalense]|uniref:Uncharacterized protein n=1 Tax=Candidatus Bilamarchaeum dharawalense TaxID=2885759 RepID=A0A5E4LSE5_9ARCH|nr:Uncharacterised protein [Candidatus Bilamarchaeum dharawalense]